MYELGIKIVSETARKLLASANVSPESIFTEHKRRADEHSSGEKESAFLTYHKLENAAAIVTTAQANDTRYTWIVAVSEEQLEELKR